MHQPEGSGKQEVLRENGCLYHAVIAQYLMNERNQLQREFGSVYQLPELYEITKGQRYGRGQAGMTERNKITFVRKIEKKLFNVYGMNVLPEKKEVTDGKFPGKILEMQDNRVCQITLECSAFRSTVKF